MTDAHLLTEVGLNESLQIARLEGEADSWLPMFGLYPGTKIELIQKFPAFVIRSGSLELALEKKVARQVHVHRSTDES